MVSENQLLNRYTFISEAILVLGGIAESSCVGMSNQICLIFCSGKQFHFLCS